jgi:hypothetical protein
MKKSLALASLLTTTLAVLTACGGGGGGGTSVDTNSNTLITPVTPTTPLTPTTPVGNYTISGSVLSASGAPIQGVQINLSGAQTATTISNSNGAFSFVGATNGSYNVSASAAGLTFTPSTKTISVAGAASTGLVFSSAYASTQVINDAMVIFHTQMLTNHATAEEALLQQLSAQGQLRSGNALVQTSNLYASYIEKFTNDSLNFLVLRSSTQAIDREAMKTLFNKYAAIDKAYVDTHFNAAVIATTKQKIDGYYALAILTFP